MELTVALLLRVYGTLPDFVLAGLRNFRSQLRPEYRQAYLDCIKTTFPSAQIETGQRRFAVNGFFLDLNIRYSAERMIEFGLPKVLSAFEAIATFASADIPARSYLPLNMTAVAKMIVDHTRTLYPARRTRGARPTHLS